MTTTEHNLPETIITTDLTGRGWWALAGKTSGEDHVRLVETGFHETEQAALAELHGLLCRYYRVRGTPVLRLKHGPLRPDGRLAS